VLCGVLHPKVHNNGFEKKKKKSIGVVLEKRGQSARNIMKAAADKECGCYGHCLVVIMMPMLMIVAGTACTILDTSKLMNKFQETSPKSQL
jgi:hypothetical protein